MLKLPLPAPAMCVAGTLLVILLSPIAAASPPVPSSQLAYPETKRVDQVDDYHGVKVANPYRWLEDLDAADTRAWIDAENALTNAYLEAIPSREGIAARLTHLWDFERYGVPFRRGDRYFFTRNDGLQNQSVLYWTPDLAATPRVLLDPNALSADGTRAVSGLSVSEDGGLLAYAVSDGGSDWRTIHVRDVATGADRPDRIEWVKFAAASWDRSGEGFYYSRYPAPQGDALSETNYGHSLYYHKLGTPQAEDVLIYERPDHKEWLLNGGVTDDGTYLIISARQGSERTNAIYYKDLTLEDAPVVPLLTAFDAEYAFIDNDGPVFWFRTDQDAPRYRVIAIDTENPQREHWQVILPEAPETLAAANVVADRLIGQYLKDVQSEVRVFSRTGRLERTVALPGPGTAVGFGGRRRDSETFYSFTGYATPPTIYRYDVAAGTSTLFRKPEVDFNPDDYETTQVFYDSRDGTRIPLFLTYRKGLKRDGMNPTYLYGYGGFNVPLRPYFSVSNLVWMEMGGVLAVANLRGGGEYGRAWYEAGRLAHKQNVFDDFVAAAHWLIDNRYTSPARLAIGGGSNGGLLVGACITQEPGLFAAALPAVGVLDMLRFPQFTIGWAWMSEYGDPQDPQDFKTLFAYSPLHNVKPGTAYPATLITTGDHDDRVAPAHSFKFAAALQAAQAGPAPVLIRIETRAGHGAGKPTWMAIEEQADRWAFLVQNLGFTPAPVSAATEP